jgi:hypothetical protein
MAKMSINETREYMEKARSLFGPREEFPKGAKYDRMCEGCGHTYREHINFLAEGGSKCHNKKDKKCQCKEFKESLEMSPTAVPQKDKKVLPPMPEGVMGRQQNQQSREQNEIHLLKNALRKKAFFRNFMKQSQEFITGLPVPGGEDASDAVSPLNIIVSAIEDELSGDMSIYD